MKKPKPTKPEGLTIRASGHLGDLLFTAGLLRNLGGKHDLILVDSDKIIGPFLPNVPLIIDILKAQPYIKSVSIVNQPAALDLTNFRRQIMRADHRTRTLMWSQTKEAEELLGREIPYDTSPWISNIEPHSYSPGRIIIARSHRYRNHLFPWRRIVDRFNDRLLFVGLPQEYSDFIERFGYVEWFRTKTLMEVAQLMASADLVIANQSSPHAVALGMGVDLISEVSPQHPDCVFNRPNVQYSVDGSCRFEDFSADGMEIDISKIDIGRTPPGRWQYQDRSFSSVDDGVRYFWNLDKNLDRIKLKNDIVLSNVLRLRGFFASDVEQVTGGVWREALANAGIPIKQNGLHELPGAKNQDA